jgi:deoxycytidylate deaminase/dephospho-CoA kinase
MTDERKGDKNELKAEDAIERLSADVIIIGFTGALGSGCSYFSEGLKNFYSYQWIKLSKYIREEAIKRGLEETVWNLQNVGNELRLKHGNDWLARMALVEADEMTETIKRQGVSRKSKVVIDGIRNVDEIEIIRQLPNFFLISVQADEVTRLERMIDDKKCTDYNDFKKIDDRDAEEGLHHGQQVKRCNDLSDIILVNEEFKNKADDLAYRKYINEKLFDKYINQIEALAEGKRSRQLPDIDQSLMTAAYVESRRSSCLKRKVGAVISAVPQNQKDSKRIREAHIISSGFNEVPLEEPTCLEHREYQGCARDFLIENLGKTINNCPNCGEKIDINIECEGCKSNITEYKRICPKCKRGLSVQYECSVCKKEIFKEYLPGGNPNTGKMLDMCRALHAEENAILNLSMRGVPSPDYKMVLYTTTYPCNLCANKILKVGIKEVVYAEPYETIETKELFENNKDKVTLKRFEGVKSNAYFRFFSLGGPEDEREKGRKA